MKFCAEHSTFAFTLVCLIEANSVFVCFEAGLQLKNLFQQSYRSKISHIICVTFLFVCLIMGCSFYCLLWGLKAKRIRNLMEDKEKVFQSYLIKNAASFIKNVLFGLFQALFMNSYYILISLLCFLKVLLIICSKKGHPYERSKYLSFCGLFYLIFGVLYDIYLLLTHAAKTESWKEMQDTLKKCTTIIELVLIGGIILTVLVEISILSVLSATKLVEFRKRTAKYYLKRKKEVPANSEIDAQIIHMKKERERKAERVNPTFSIHFKG